MVEFTKVGDYKYITTAPDSVVKMVGSLIDQLSDGKSLEYDNTLNNMLFDNMLGRYIASQFVKQIDTNTDTGFTIIDVTVGSRTISISVGSVNMGEEKKIFSGVYYK